MAKLILKRGKDARVRAGHPWIYRGEVAEVVGDWRAGEAVTVLDSQGRFLGRGFYNPRPSLVCRLLTDRKSTRLNSSHIQKSRMPSSA